MSLQIVAGLANILCCVKRAESSRSCGMSPRPSLGTEVTLHQATCRGAGMELCTGTANVTVPQRDPWHPSVIPHGRKRNVIVGFLMTQSSQTFGALSYIRRMSLAGALQRCPLWCTASLSPWPGWAHPHWGDSNAWTSQGFPGVLPGRYWSETPGQHSPSDKIIGRKTGIVGQMFLQTEFIFST